MTDASASAVATTPRETERAALAKERYVAMEPPRSCLRLAQMLAQEQSQIAEAERRAGQPARRVSSVMVIERRLKEWSRLFGWVEYARQADQDRVDEQRRAKEAELRTLNDNDAIMARGMKVRSMTRLNRLMEVDEAALANWERQMDVIRQARDRALRDNNIDLAASYEFPTKPRLYVTGHVLAELTSLAFEQERLALQEGTESVREQGSAGLPNVLEVRLTVARPPEPVDPLGDGDDLGDVVDADSAPPVPARPAPPGNPGSAMIPAGMVGLTSHRPQPPQDPYTDDQGDDPDW